MDFLLLKSSPHPIGAISRVATATKKLQLLNQLVGMMTIASVCDGVQECKNNSDEEFCSQDSLTTVILGKSTFVCLLGAKYQISYHTFTAYFMTLS